jgi:UDP-N-acetylglucosamine--N-acetylmuramyl-(pentapeptide) pyrophosphoryl-undecaprenol N-acetylglucosamine transferase
MVDIQGKREDALRHFNLKSDRITVFAMGGSLGALTINESIATRLQDFQDKGIQLIWQCGKTFFPRAKEITESHNWEGICLDEFIREMDLAYAAADVILSRSGAMSLSEICLVGKRSILVPLPHAAEDHQTHNAKSLVDKEAAILVKDSEARSVLVDTLFELISDEGRMQNMSKNMVPLGILNSDDRIAEIVDTLISSPKS